MTRFFVRPEQITGSSVSLDADDAHHLRVVLKAAAGASLVVLDGSGREWAGVLTELGKTRAVANLSEPTSPNTETRTRITVAQGLPKIADKMESVLQHGTEIGVAAFWGMETARSQTHLTGERQAKRLTRWQGIVKTAAEQSRRTLLPDVQARHTFADVCHAAPEFDLSLVAWEGETEHTLRGVLELKPSPKSVLIVIGPEGGFTDKEAEAARRAGLQTVSLGPRILRTETAALALAAQIIYALG